jgi:hypothetical protein
MAKGPHMNSRRGRKPNRRRALELLAGSRDGMTEAMLLAHGFMVDMLVDLIRSASRPSGEWGEDDYAVLADRCAPRGMMAPCIFFCSAIW